VCAVNARVCNRDRTELFAHVLLGAETASLVGPAFNWITSDGGAAFDFTLDSTLRPSTRLGLVALSEYLPDPNNVKFQTMLNKCVGVCVRVRVRA
jgi:hypothetical protein